MQGLAIVVNTTAEQEKRLEALLPWHRGHTDRDGKHPHSEWNTSDMLECLISIHAKELVEFLLSVWQKKRECVQSGEAQQ